MTMQSTATRPTTGSSLREAGLDREKVLAVVRAAMAEDLAEAGDLTSQAIVPADTHLEVTFTARERGVLCGLPVLSVIVDDVIGTDAALTLLADDGDAVEPDQPLAILAAPARAVLAVERTALNLLCHLSGIATATRAWVDAVAGTGVAVRDTRKTTPLLRSLEKYAVRCGGGTNHRAGLFDQILVKDNHVAVAGGVGNALDLVAAAHPDRDVAVQVEVDSLAQLEEALVHGADRILLDNFTLDDLRAAVARVRSNGRRVHLEASGGLRLDGARAVASTGVDSLSVGVLTHSSPALDIGLDAVAPDEIAHRPRVAPPRRGASRRSNRDGLD
jgi:nicotinate-nucleotide pyrophosphorylase (carboxylating)